jgi:predicted O-methyltransferase YrrM
MSQTAQELWTAVDAYIDGLLFANDAVLESALAASIEAGLPPISVTPSQGKLLCLLAQISGARRILEIGTLGGYSTLWLARALPPDGRILTLEFSPKHAAVARANFARAGFTDRIEVRVGAALDTLPQIAAEDGGPFDFIFLDANKDGYPEYLTWALRLSRPGTVIVADNVVRDGEILQAEIKDIAVQGAQRFNAMLAAESTAAQPRLSATILQTVGSKGYDGFALARVLCANQ